MELPDEQGREPVGLVQVWNYQTNKGENRTDLQVHIGVKFDPVGMFSK